VKRNIDIDLSTSPGAAILVAALQNERRALVARLALIDEQIKLYKPAASPPAPPAPEPVPDQAPSTPRIGDTLPLRGPKS